MIHVRKAIFAFFFLFLIFAGGIHPCNAEAEVLDSPSLEQLDLEGLLEVEVISPTNRKQSLENIAGSYTVLTEEDIKASGAMSVPEALRVVPGVLVTRMDTNKWAIGIRGFNGMFNSKQLILIDNRPITSPFYSEVIWSNNDLPIELVKRIEVIRGPWTSLWGSESLNGVIKIITKSAKELKGTQSVSVVGTDGVNQMIRQGGELSDENNFMVYAKGGYESGKSYKVKGTAHKGSKDLVKGNTGFRSDWQNAFTDQLTLQGDISASSIKEHSPPGTPFSANREKKEYGGYAQFTWDRATGINSGMQFRTSYTHSATTFDDLNGISNTVDAEFLYSAEQIGMHLMTFGVGGRYFWDSFEQGKHVTVHNDQFSRMDVSAFAQDKMTLIEESLFLTLGLKLDYSEKVNISPQATARLLYTADKDEYWIAASRATKTPSNWAREGRYEVKYRGERYEIDTTNGLESEELTSFEAGYRRIFSDNLKFDLSLYFNSYDKLLTLSYDKDTRIATPTSSLCGLTYGTEASLDWKALPRLTLRPSISLSNQDFTGSSIDSPGFAPPLNSPIYNVKLQALINLADNLDLDLFTSYLNSMDDKDLSTGFSFDARLAWRPVNNLSFELIGSSLLSPINDGNFAPTKPSGSLRVIWDF
ncbi:iron complex outermembrane recepter protein [Maridesulfovibrio ferrireducens]|uniref:Iron complex outermembrane recepter protein n=1 Tax=Maridesulfovibrio ferrireducens TaxID=246191 RepID=A0A1G9JIR8_9BACT|nr:TonB-dependent receptor plug domain-containing protein [Maridesulfovibrio ferrireducens]SDL37155.1 iron complex outermembrane recepter protein [Maridesulfovibrio ferrireducens]